MDKHIHLYATAPGERKAYMHQRRGETYQALDDWGKRHLDATQHRLRKQCDGGPGCPGTEPVDIEELQAGPQRFQPGPDRKLSRNVRALIGRRATKRRIPVDQVVREAITLWDAAAAVEEAS